MPPALSLPSTRTWAQLQERYDRTALRVRSEVGTDLPIPPPRKRTRPLDGTSLLARTWTALRRCVDEACRARRFALDCCVHPRVAEDRRFVPAALALFRDCDVALFGNNLVVLWGAECETEDSDASEGE